MNLILLFSSILFPLEQHFILDKTIYYSEFNCIARHPDMLTARAFGSSPSQSLYNMFVEHVYHGNIKTCTRGVVTALKGCMSKIIKLFCIIHDFIKSVQ